MTPELVVLALFDNQISVDDKQLMAATLVSFVRPKVFKHGKPDFNEIIVKLGAEKTNLSEFINAQSWLLFEKAEAYLNTTNSENCLS